jgi:hypothetical protein
VIAPVSVRLSFPDSGVRGVTRGQASTTSLMRSMRMSRMFRRFRRYPMNEVARNRGGTGIRNDSVTSVPLPLGLVQVVDCAVAQQHGETELATRLARGHPASRPVDRTDLVTLDMTTEPSTHRGFGNPSSHSASNVSGENRPVFRTSATSVQTSSAGASM